MIEQSSLAVKGLISWRGIKGGILTVIFIVKGITCLYLFIPLLFQENIWGGQWQIFKLYIFKIKN